MASLSHGLKSQLQLTWLRMCFMWRTPPVTRLTPRPLRLSGRELGWATSKWRNRWCSPSLLPQRMRPPAAAVFSLLETLLEGICTIWGWSDPVLSNGNMKNLWGCSIYLASSATSLYIDQREKKKKKEWISGSCYSIENWFRLGREGPLIRF